MKNLAYVIILMVCFVNCNKEKYSCTVTGKVINYGNQKGIAGATVFLEDGVGAYDPIINSSSSSGKYVTATTDSNGFFSISLKGEYSPFISAFKQRYHRPDYGPIEGIATGTTNNYMINLVSYANCEFTIKPLFVPLPTDYLAYNYSPMSYDYSIRKSEVDTTIGMPEPEYINAINFNTQKIKYDSTIVIGDRYCCYRIRYTKNSKSYNLIDSVYIKSFETYKGVIELP